MDIANPESIKILADLGQTISVTAFMFWALVAFYRGDIVSRSTLEKIIASVLVQIDAALDKRLSELRNEIKNEIEKKRGGW